MKRLSEYLMIIRKKKMESFITSMIDSDKSLYPKHPKRDWQQRSNYYIRDVEYYGESIKIE